MEVYCLSAKQRQVTWVTSTISIVHTIESLEEQIKNDE